MTSTSGFLEMCLVAAAAALVLVPNGVAHDGPPYPILVDERVDGWTLSVWADPDVGTGTFYYYVEPPAGRSVAELSIGVVSAPEDGASAEVEGSSQVADDGASFQLTGMLAFDHRGTWPTRFVLSDLARGGAILGELVFDLEVTPPGLGALDILWFAFPFLAIIGLWLRALLAQRAHDRSGPAPETPVNTPPCPP